MHLSTLRAEDAPFLVTKKNPLLLHIIDDVAVITVDWPAALIITWHQLKRNILRLNHLPVADTKSSHPLAVVQDSLTFAGCNWNLQQGIIERTSDKFKRVTACVKSLLESQAVRLQDGERVVRKLLWFATLNRPLLACTNRLFYGDKFLLPNLPISKPNACKRELQTLTALLPLSRVDLNLPLCPIIVAFDASKLAGAVAYANAPSGLATKLWNAAQKVRFSQEVPTHEKLQKFTEAINACQWRLAFVHYWRKEEHISSLEAATAVLSADWITRSRMSDVRVIFLTDSLVTLGALQKGRSSKTGLLLRCRGFAALVLAHNIRACFAYVCSAMNPADPYTRIPRH